MSYYHREKIAEIAGRWLEALEPIPEGERPQWSPEYEALLKKLKGKTLKDFDIREEPHPAGFRQKYYYAYFGKQLIAGGSMEAVRREIGKLLQRATEIDPPNPHSPNPGYHESSNVPVKIILPPECFTYATGDYVSGGHIVSLPKDANPQSYPQTPIDWKASGPLKTFVLDAPPPLALVPVEINLNTLSPEWVNKGKTVYNSATRKILRIEIDANSLGTAERLLRHEYDHALKIIAGVKVDYDSSIPLAVIDKGEMAKYRASEIERSAEKASNPYTKVE